jgi:hypothetical protein
MLRTFVGHVCSLLAQSLLFALKFNVTTPNRHTLLCGILRRNLASGAVANCERQLSTVSLAKTRSVSEQTAAKLFRCESNINHQKL